VKSKVAVLRTSPETVVEDYGRLMDLAGYREALPFDVQTCLRINISWHVYMPACSTTPWQMHGVIRKLRQDGYDVSRDLIAAQNDTVVVSCRVGAVNNHLQPVLEHYGVPIQYLSEPGTEWLRYEPKAKMLVLDRVFDKIGIQIPKLLMGKSVIHLPTVKTHVFTGTTGAMKNAFGGLLNLNRHWTHSVIHETLVDLLRIQKEIHPGIFAVMDGTIAGEGPGPRAMRPHVKNVILASSDCVAIDAIAAKLMGFDPMKDLKFIRLAHEHGLGVGNPSEIELVGDDVREVNFGFRGSLNENTFASWGQKLIYWGPLKPLENLLLRSPIVPWSYLASRAYHDGYWYPVQGKPRVKEIMKTGWGSLFRSYANGALEHHGTPEKSRG
jgi:uncharacterized protein (DUF362 family)